MKVRDLFLAAALPAALVLIGCGPTSNTGGGGTHKDTAHDSSHDSGKGDDKADKFTLEGPAGIQPYGLKQGESKTYDIKVNKGKEFKEDVTLSFEGPKELEVTMTDKKVAKSTDGKAQFTVKAADKAPVGEHTIKVTGKPESGPSTSLELKFKVEEKK